MIIDEAIAMISHIKEYIVDNQGDKEYGGALDMAIEALERTRWIPVSERLPEFYEPVVVINNSKVLNIARRAHTSDWDLYGITHWMPLPPAPEQEV